MKKLLLFVCLSITSLAFNQKHTVELTDADWDRIIKSSAQPLDFNLIELEFIQLLNEYRNQLNLTSLSFDPELKKATNFHVNYMTIHDTLSHKQPDLEYASYSDRIRNLTNVLSKPGISGECLSQSETVTAYILNKSVAAFLLYSWKISPKHNEIITCNTALRPPSCSNNT